MMEFAKDLRNQLPISAIDQPRVPIGQLSKFALVLSFRGHGGTS